MQPRDTPRPVASMFFAALAVSSTNGRVDTGKDAFSLFTTIVFAAIAFFITTVRVDTFPFLPSKDVSTERRRARILDGIVACFDQSLGKQRDVASTRLGRFGFDEDILRRHAGRGGDGEGASGGDREKTLRCFLRGTWRVRIKDDNRAEHELFRRLLPWLVSLQEKITRSRNPIPILADDILTTPNDAEDL